MCKSNRVEKSDVHELELKNIYRSNKVNTKTFSHTFISVYVCMYIDSVYYTYLYRDLMKLN